MKNTYSPQINLGVSNHQGLPTKNSFEKPKTPPEQEVKIELSLKY
jgi:hypothetical protein